MNYKHSRKERIAKYMGDSHYELKQLLKDLLAQKEDRKECEHQYLLKQDHFYCVVCGKSTKPTPSPLEIEEIEEIDLTYFVTDLERNAFINALIRNQKKLYQFIKEKL